MFGAILGEFTGMNAASAHAAMMNRAMLQNQRYALETIGNTYSAKPPAGYKLVSIVSAGMADAGKRAAIEAPLRARIAELEAALEDRGHGR